MGSFLILNLTYLIAVGTTARAAEGSPPREGARILFFAGARAVRHKPPPVTPHQVQTLLRSAAALARELTAADLPIELRAELTRRVGGLIASAWSQVPPSEDQVPIEAVRQLIGEAKSSVEASRRAADAGLSAICSVLHDHALVPAVRAEGALASSERAVTALSLIDHPAAVTALVGISRDAREKVVREYAARRLGELARRRSPADFAEACARLLLD